jgi:small-conductance mechanosensitive channel
MDISALINYLSQTKLWLLVFIIVVLFIVHHFVLIALNQYIHEPTLRHQSRKLSSGILMLAAVIATTLLFKEQLGSLGVALSVAGAGIAFALQEVIASVAGWATISFNGFFRTGDRVELGGIKGDVIDIGVLRTTLLELGEWVNGDLYNGRIVRVANSFVFKAPVFNYSADFPFLWDELTVPVHFGSEYTYAKTVFADIATKTVGDYVPQSDAVWQNMLKKYLIEDAGLNPTVTISFNENWVTFTLRYVVNYKKRRTVKDSLSSQILTAIEQSNGRISIGVSSSEVSYTKQVLPTKNASK